MNKANLFLVGAAKAGTTSLYHYLVNHEEIFAKIKEPWYFIDKAGLTKGDKVHNLEEYEKLFETSKSHKYYIDGSPSYLCFPQVGQDIYNYNKQSKIIIVLRNPINRVKSYYRMYYMNGYEGTLREFLEYKGTF